MKRKERFCLNSLWSKVRVTQSSLDFLGPLGTCWKRTGAENDHEHFLTTSIKSSWSSKKPVEVSYFWSIFMDLGQHEDDSGTGGDKLYQGPQTVKPASPR